MSADSGTQPTPNPFPGLRPFRTEEDYLFFGREEQTADLLRLLREHRFLAVVGTSGSGKSSLVRAGLVPALHKGTMAAAGSSWEVIIQRPGGNPMRNLATALCDADLYDPDDAESVPRLVATLRHSTQGLVEAYRQSDIEPGTNLLVVVDQFEELFRFSQNDAESRDQSRAFVNLLLEASRQSEHPVYIVVTMRSDYLGDCSQIHGLAEAVNEGEYLIPRLSREQLRSAIEGPAKVGGGGITNRLVQRLLNDVGDDPDQLPVLQHALMRTWDARAEVAEMDIGHYESIGEMADALSRHADEIYMSLPSDRERDLAVRVFKTLTEKGPDNRGIRRPTRMRALKEIAAADEEASLLLVLNAYRAPGVTFLMPGMLASIRDNTVIDISHESLMRVWRRLRSWVEEEAQSARIFRRLADTAALWNEGKAGLYHDPDLQIAQSWREEYAPNEAWAKQYAPGFTEAIAFLDASHEAVASIEREREAARQRELAQARALAEAKSRAAANFRRFSIGVAVLAVAAIGLAMWAFQLWGEAERHRTDAVRSEELARTEAQHAREAESEAVALAEAARHEQGRVWVERARALLDEKRHLGAKILAARAVGFEGYGRDAQDVSFQSAYDVLLKPDSEERRVVEQIITNEPDYATVWQSAGSAIVKPIYAVAYGPNDRVAAGDADGNVYVWNAKTGERIPFSATHAAAVTSVLFAGDGGSIVSTSRDRTVRLGNIDGDKQVWVMDAGVFVRSSALAPDGRSVAIACNDGRIRVLSMSDGQESSSLGESGPAVVDVSFSPRAPLLAAGHANGRLSLWNVGDGSLLGRHEAHRRSVLCVRITPDGKHLASVSRDGSVKVFEITDGGQSLNAVQTWTGFAGAVERAPSRIAFHPTEPLAAVATGAGPIHLRSFPDGAELGRLSGHFNLVRGVAFSPDGSRLFSGCVSGTARLWDVEARKELTPHQGEGLHWAMDAAFSRDGRTLISSSADGNIRMVELQTGKVCWRYTLGEELTLNEIVHSPDGARLAVKLLRGVRILDVGKREEIQRLATGRVFRIRWSPEGRTLATAGPSGSVELWSVADAKRVAKFGGLASSVWGLDFSPDGRQLAAGDADGVLSVWDTASQEKLRGWTLPRAVWTLAFSPDGTVLATAGATTAVTLWDVSRDPPVVTDQLDAHERTSIRALAYSPDGRILASSGDDATIRLWNIETKSLRATLDGHRDSVLSVDFAPDGRSLVSTSLDRTVRLWEIDPQSDARITDPNNYFLGAKFLDDNRLITGGRTALQIVERETARVVRSFPAIPVSSVQASRDGRYVAGGSAGGMTLWDVDTGEELARYSGTARNNPGTAFSPDGRFFAAPLGDRIRIYKFGDRTTQSLMRPAPVWTVGFGPTGRLYAGDSVGALSVLDPDADWQEVAHVKVSARTLTRLAVSQDGSLLATAGHDGYIRLWDAETLEKRWEKAADSAVVWLDVAFDAAGRTLASISTGDRTLRLWDVQDGTQIRSFEPAEFLVFSVDFSPDGQSVVVGGFSSTLILHDDVRPDRSGSGYAAYLDHMEIEGRKVRPRAVEDLFAQVVIPFRPRRQDTHLAILARGGTQDDVDRALFRHYVRTRNLQSAAVLLRRLPEDSRQAEADEFVQHEVKAVDALTARGLTGLALARLTLAAELLPDALELARSRAKALVAAGEREAAMALLDKTVEEARRRGEGADAVHLDLLRDRIQLYVDAGDLPLARDRFAEFLAPERFRDAAAREKELNGYLERVSTALTARAPTDAQARRGLQAVGLGAVVSAAEAAETVEVASIPAVAALVKNASRGAGPRVLVPRDAEWRFWDDAAPPDASWRNPEFDDAKWRSGPAPLGFGDRREKTRLEPGQLVYYARTRFQLDDVAALKKRGGLVLRYARDDAVAIHLNGSEVHRDNLPSGTLGHSTQAMGSMSGAQETAFHQTTSPALSRELREGGNVFAVSIHQSGPGSSDVHFELELAVDLTPASYVAAMTDQEITSALQASHEFVPKVVVDAAVPLVRFALLSEVNEQEPLVGDPSAWQRRARVQRSLGRWESVLAAYRRGVELAKAAREPKSLALADAIESELYRFLVASGRDDEARAMSQEWVAFQLQTHGAVRINAGGEAFVDSRGNRWAADRLHEGGYTYFEGTGDHFVEDIPNTEDDPVYQTERVFRPPGSTTGRYTIPLPAGPYVVRLHFSEIFVKAEGERVFDVSLGGKKVLTDFDPFAAAGGFAKPHVEEFKVEVGTEPLVLELTPKLERVKVAGIEVIVPEG